jgi:hypothetical protein
MTAAEWVDLRGTIPVDRSGCWLWPGPLNAYGYGVWKRGTLAHRMVYELLAGPIASELTLDHLCRVRRCVNPAHLEQVPIAVNILRGTCNAAQNARKTHCDHGHPFDLLNTLVRRDGKRECRACAARRCREKRQRRAERTA